MQTTKLGDGNELREDEDYIIAYNSGYGALAKYNKKENRTETMWGRSVGKGNRLSCYMYPIPHGAE